MFDSKRFSLLLLDYPELLGQILKRLYFKPANNEDSNLLFRIYDTPTQEEISSFQDRFYDVETQTLHVDELLGGDFNIYIDRFENTKNYLFIDGYEFHVNLQIGGRVKHVIFEDYRQNKIIIY
jgi:hypothetical protein